MYGCIFCINDGQTPNESDATVFFSSKALLNHLSHHPRPLPRISGLTVMDGAQVPDHQMNDFDLHFKNPPRTHPTAQHAAEIAQQPSGVTRDHARKLYGQRRLADKSATLELAQGAKISGITFPAAYRGEWIFAWHEGVFASIPTELVRLNPPPMSEIKMGETSQIRARAQWKFAPKDKDAGDWLKFDKDDVISNISCKSFELRARAHLWIEQQG